MKKSKKEYLIPFRRDDRPGREGELHMMEYAYDAKDGQVRVSGDRATWYHPDEWRKPEPFFAELVLAGWGKGRSSARFYVINAANMERYSFGMASFYAAVETYGVWNKTLCGLWTFRKQGSNYLLVPLPDGEGEKK